MERARNTRLGIQNIKRRVTVHEQKGVVKVPEFRLITCQTLTNLHFISMKVDQLSSKKLRAGSDLESIILCSSRFRVNAECAIGDVGNIHHVKTWWNLIEHSVVSRDTFLSYLCLLYKS